MKRLIIATIILLIAAILVTVGYFKNLNTATRRSGQVLRTIPNNASLIFEFSNEKGFYDIFSDNKLFTSLIGEEKMTGLNAVKKLLVQNPSVEPILGGQNVYLSLHPQAGNDIDFLLTIAIPKTFEPELFERLSKQQKSGIVINTFTTAGKQGYIIYFNELKKRFYLINQDDNTLSGSFSKKLIEDCARYDYKKEKQAFVLLSDRQSANSLASLYVNYEALTPLFEQVFNNKNPDVFRSFRQLPAFGALSLNYKRDAIMFNGTTQLHGDVTNSYLGLFTNQQPIINQLKTIFPSTTAYSINFAVSDPAKFEVDLRDKQSRENIKLQMQSINKKIKAETGVNLDVEFDKLLSNEFAIVTTRYREKIAIIRVKDGSKARSLLINISQMITDNTGQFNYEKLPQMLLGDAFAIFKKPYFKVMDNYLILTNSPSELTSYDDSYLNRKFLNKTEGYNQFDALLAERSNVSFFIYFKNAQPLFKQDLKPSFYNAYEHNVPGWKNFYAAAWQLTSSDKNYYTNFCIRLNADTVMDKDTF